MTLAAGRMVRVAIVDPLTLIVCGVLVHGIGCTSEQFPNTVVARLDKDDAKQQARVGDVLRTNGMEVVGGHFLGEDNEPPAFVVCVKPSDQDSAARLISADAEKGGYEVKIHWRGRSLTVNEEHLGERSKWPFRVRGR